MVDRELSNYIIRSLTLARDEAQVRAELTGAGWSAGEINDAYSEARRLLDASWPLGQVPVKLEHAGLPQVQMARITAGRVFLFIGVLVIISAAVFFLTINWQNWTPLMRFMSLLVPMLLCGLIGVYLWGHREKAVAVFFLMAAGLLLPFVLFALSSEYITDYFFDSGHQTSAFPWGVALLVSTVVYMLCRRILGLSAWSFLAATAAILGTGAISTLFVITQARGGESVLNAYMWGMLIASAVVVYVAIGREKAGQASDATLLYLPPALGMKISLLVLAFTGAYTYWLFYVESPGYHSREWLYISSSLIISGAVALFLAWGIGRLLKRGWVFPWPYRVTFGAFGTLLVLLGGLVMATAEKETWYLSLIWLALILGFIFAGQRMQVRSFLYIGTLFMVIFVFAVGFMYFEDQAGWPLVLFAAGLISLALGFMAERMSRSWKKESSK